jgi:6-phosphofructokinase 1
LLVGQSGGATAVINASLAGVITAAAATDAVASVVGMRHGIAGLLHEDFVDLGQQAATTLARLRRTPSAALGTGRHKVSDDDLAKALTLLQRHNIRYFIYIGGNDSSDTAHRLHHYAAAQRYDLRVAVVPKTIDNDLPHTDHCPGYGSMARYLALATRDAGCDTEASPQLYPVKIIEVMGRNAGWVAAACGLWRDDVRDAPQLIFLPERPPTSLAGVLEEIAAAVQQHGYCVAIVPETLRDVQGNPLSSGERGFVDPFGHQYHPGLAPFLTERVKDDLGLRARYDKPGTMARMSMLAASPVDLAEAEEAGRHTPLPMAQCRWPRLRTPSGCCHQSLLRPMAARRHQRSASMHCRCWATCQHPMLAWNRARGRVILSGTVTWHSDCLVFLRFVWRGPACGTGAAMAEGCPGCYAQVAYVGCAS